MSNYTLKRNYYGLQSKVEVIHEHSYKRGPV
ncbi:hypothetical protein T4B_5581 [Trichinella pseudospiralis]|uniref:Uncharacterized protein n=1 Tax=Trichinella pseudospiralis TaxID=6337 RepID=A0A0V1GIU5_TRIPS|nr:hypothetical protein T4B_5581 [Trichinella pseudospiralis]